MLNAGLLLAFPSFLGAGCMLALALGSYVSSQRNAARAFTVFCLVVFVWCFGAAAEQLSPDLAARIAWAKLEHIGIASVGLAWFAFCAFYTATLERPRRTLLTLGILPLVSLLLVWTNEGHGLIWRDIRWNGVDADFVRGGWFNWIYLPYNYLLFSLGSLRLVRSYMRASASYRSSLLVLILSAFFPVVPNLLYLSGVTGLPIDLTPLGFALSGMVGGFALLRYRFLQREPVALQRLLETLPDAVLLLDLDGRVLESNGAAQALFGSAQRGQALATLVPELGSLEYGVGRELYLQGGRAYQVRLERLEQGGSVQVAKLLRLREVSEYVRATERLEQQAAFQEALLESVRTLLDAEVGPKVYQMLLEQAMRVIPGAEAGTVVMQRPDGLFGYVASVGFDLDILSRVRFERHELFYGEALSSTPVLATHLSRFNARVLDAERVALIQQAGFQTQYTVSLGLPIFLEGELLAVLSLDNASDPHAFGPETQRLAEGFAKHIGAALQKARFKGQLERGVRAQTLLARVERLLLETSALRNFFPQLAEVLFKTEGLGVDQLIVYEQQGKILAPHVYNGDAKRERLIQADLQGTELLDLSAAAGSELGFRCVQEREPIYLADTRQECDWVQFESNPVRSVLMCPVFRHGELWGILEYASDRPHAFGAESRDLLVSIAQSTELALAREDDRNKLELELLRMNTVVSSAETMRTLGTRQEIFGEAVAALVRRTQAHRGALAWYDAERDALVIQAIERSGEEVPEISPGTVLPRGCGVSWRVLEGDATLYVDDVETLKRVQLFEAGVTPRAYAGTPLRDTQGRPLGILFAFKAGEGSAFDASDVAYLEAIALAASNALVRLDLLGEAEAKASAYRDLYRTAERQHQELVLLDRVRTALARELDLTRVARTLVTVLSETLGYASVSLYRLEDKTFALRERAGLQAADETLKQELFARAVREGRPLLEAREGSAWEVAVPLYGHEAVLGMLSVRSGAGREGAETDLKLLGALGEQASIALERALLYSYMQRSEERFRLLAENMSDLVCLHGVDGGLRYVSPSSQAVLGLSPEDLLSQPLAPRLHPEDLNVVLARLKSGLETKRAEPLRFRLRHADGAYRWFEAVTHPLFDTEGVFQGFTSSSRDVTDRQTMEEQLRYGAHYDSLTQLPNRARFLERLDYVLAMRDPTLGTAVLFIDLDRFKMVNDTLGHQAGDALLRQLSARLLKHVRPGDMVARLSGDEFCVLLEGLASEEGALRIVTRVLREVAAPYSLEGRECFISASIGIAFATLQPQRAEDLLRNADIAMYRAKHGGRDAYAVFDESMHQEMVERLTLEGELRHALERGELKLHYQPIFDLKTGALTGLEALSRWSVACQVIAPDLFIPIAEETGLITELDTWAVREACRQLALWQQRFSLPSSLRMSVNLASASFEQPDLLENLRRTLYETGLPASCLTLELTERTVMKDSAEGVNMLQALRQLGVRVQVDDFGTGYSSLRYLHTLPLDSLKIDRSFIAQLTSGHSEAVVRSILALAKELHLQVVAEGIETAEQLRELRALECDQGQGYLLSRPLTPEGLEASLLQNRAWTDRERALREALPNSLSN